MQIICAHKAGGGGCTNGKGPFSLSTVFVPPVRYAPPNYRACHHMVMVVNQYVKILHVLLGFANNMHPLRWGGGVHKRKRSVKFLEKHVHEQCKLFVLFSDDSL